MTDQNLGESNVATIEDLIQQEANPFDPVTFKVGNFWLEDQTVTATVDSIHQEAIDQITQILEQIAQEHHTRTVLLEGDAGSGKSYVLKRLKQSLNSKAFFVYIPPFVDSDHIWRHTLRQTVDSLMNKPEGKNEPQLLLWLKSLSAFSNPSLLKKLFGERNFFINNFKNAYPVGIYQAKEFFGILYDLTNPDLYMSACNWLRGDDLDEDELRALKVKKSIDSEAAAQGILGNLGRISTSTYPIVLCFDQVESKLLSDGSVDIQPVFTINTTFHNENFKNFLIVISIVKDIWRQNRIRIPQSDRDRIEKLISLRQITLDQAEALWQIRLAPLHHRATPKPDSKIYPLRRESLEQKNPGGKTIPRSTLVLGKELLDTYKNGEPEPTEPDYLPAFKLLWEQEFRKTEQKVSRIRQFSEPELVSMLHRLFAALQIQDIQLKLLSGSTYASQSLTYRGPQHQKKVGLVWTETSNMLSFFHTMEACRKVEEKHTCQALYLIRAEATGKTSSKGYGLYKKIFVDSPNNRHVKPGLESVYYLATYNRLVNSVHSQELLIEGKAIQLSELEAFIRGSGVLQHCSLLQELNLIAGSKPEPGSGPSNFQREKDFLLSFVKTQKLIARKVVMQNTHEQFPQLGEDQMQALIRELCQKQQISILDPAAPLEAQILCLVPQAKG